MVEHFYPSAIDRIRAKEASLGVESGEALHITMMACFILQEGINTEKGELGR